LISAQTIEVDKCLALWRQGDVVLGADLPFIHMTDLGSPVTLAAERVAAQEGKAGLALVSEEFTGFVVVTQTCDLVRSCKDRPYVEICPLVEIPEDRVELVRLGRLPRFISLSGITNKRLAVDLDRVMTIEKGLLASMTERRTKGVTSDLDAQLLAEALGRKRTRAALPDDFVVCVRRMRDRIVEKHDRNTREGEFLRAVREIRVRGIPDWAAPTIEVEFIFVFDRGANIPRDADTWIGHLLNRVTTGDRIAAVDGRPVGLDQLSAASYLESHRLDLDHLSQSS
jgi:hypothetical protein